MFQDLYKKIFVWRRVSDNEAKRYSCFENLATGLFLVQSIDFFRLPYEKKFEEQHAKQLVELIIELDDKASCAKFRTLSEAISDSDFDEAFS